MAEAVSETIVGIITRVDNDANMAYFWCKKANEEIEFVIPEGKNIQMGMWIRVRANEVRFRKITNFDMERNVLETYLVNKEPGSQNYITVNLVAHVVFPPPEWAKLCAYKNCVYAQELGKVACLAPNKLSRRNSGIKPNVVYKASIYRVPLKEPYIELAVQHETIWALPSQVLVEDEDDELLLSCPWNKDKAHTSTESQVDHATKESQIAKMSTESQFDHILAESQADYTSTESQADHTSTEAQADDTSTEFQVDNCTPQNILNGAAEFTSKEEAHENILQKHENNQAECANIAELPSYMQQERIIQPNDSGNEKKLNFAGALKNIFTNEEIKTVIATKGMLRELNTILKGAGL